MLNLLDATQPHALAYTPYGHRPPESGLLSLLGFNGERPDPVTGHYLLGNGYRAFNPVLMRFNSPDSWSPFGVGGLNAYAYCEGDPINRRDPTGHISFGAIARVMQAVSRFKSLRLSTGAASTNLPASSSTHSILSRTPAISGPRVTVNQNMPFSSVASQPSLPPTQARSSVTTPRQINRTHDSGRIGAAQRTNQSLTPAQSLPWTFSKSGAHFARRGLSDAAQGKFDIFQNSIKNSGQSPFDAAMLAGDTNLKKIRSAGPDTFQIRLSQSERAIFTIEERRVAMQQVGGHT
ncbi:RHS repeat-associated core domain-containing protein [Pseudomonas sp. QTF5]|uniref:RHS repeat-associated core domain-containing protein n=1 Tax=Pseudomonas sp. QTF5 TaxID=1435425 RepID=UPI003531FFE3